MSQLVLRLLGTPRIELEGTLVEQKLRKAVALLAYLSVTRQRHSRDSLAELLFPDKDRIDARADLRRSLSSLRGTIGSEWAGSDSSCVWFQTGAWIDVHEFRRLIAESWNREKAGDTPGCSEKLGEAMGLCRGEFLAGFYLRDCPAFEEWQLGETEALTREYASALQRLVDIQEGMGDIPAATGTARRLLAVDVLEESSHRNLMRLYALQGQRAAALRQYASCRRTLLREFGQGPGEQTEKLRDTIALRRLAAREPRETWPVVATPRSRAAKGQPRPSPDGKAVLVLDPGASGSGVYASVRVAAAVALEAAGSEALDASRVAIHVLKREKDDERQRQDALRYARLISSAAHPGQVLLSAAAVGSAAGDFPPDAGVRSLGMHRLKDLGAPQAIFQLVHPSIPQDFPALRTLDSMPNNLPVQPTPFVGRENEVTAIHETLSRDDVRLLTLTGPGGAGKTRLALQATADMLDSFDHGAYLVDLASLREPLQVVPAIAEVLGVSENAGGSRSLQEILEDYLRNKRMILLLDNFEHLLPAAPDVARILSACPHLKVMATSREALSLRAEHTFPVQPLAVPPPGTPTSALAQFEAVRFFVERVRAIQPAFSATGENASAIAGICSRMDGLPLALELAAARLKALSPAVLLERLETNAALRAEGPRDLPERQRTLHREIGWSHNLLDERDKKLFRRLAVFAGGCTEEAAAAVCAFEHECTRDDVLEGLTSLVARNLLVCSDSRVKTRYRLLETIREYALERLKESGELDAINGRLAAYLVSLAERVEPGLFRSEQDVCVDLLNTEYPNLRVALAWLLERDDPAPGITLAASLGEFWWRTWRYSEAERWLSSYYARSIGSEPPAARAKLAFYLGFMKHWLSDPGLEWNAPEAVEILQESLRLSRQAGDQRGVALTLAWLGRDRGKTEEERGVLQEQAVQIARQAGDHWSLADCLVRAYAERGGVRRDIEVKKAALVEAMALARKAGDPRQICWTIHGMGDVYFWSGDYAAAEPWFLEEIRIARENDQRWAVFEGCIHLPKVYLGLKNVERAKAACFECLRLAAGLALRTYYPEIIDDAAEIAKREARPRRSARLRYAAALGRDRSSSYDPAHAVELGLKEETARREWEAAQSMTIEQAVAFALSDQE